MQLVSVASSCRLRLPSSIFSTSDSSPLALALSRIALRVYIYVCVYVFAVLVSTVKRGNGGRGDGRNKRVRRWKEGREGEVLEERDGKTARSKLFAVPPRRKCSARSL